MSRLRNLAFLVFIFAGFYTNLAGAQSSQSENKLPSGLVQIPNNELISPYIFVVDKSIRELTVFENTSEQLRPIKRFPTDIGKGRGNKIKEGDFKTPEGIYFLETKLAGPSLNFDLYGSMAFTTNYPNYFDNKAGKTGYGIWLHAIPDTVPLTRGSRGCVVVRNDVIKELSSLIRLEQTPILIFDKVEYVEPSQLELVKSDVQSFIDSWKSAWESQNTQNYMSFYRDNFTAKNMNFKQWKRYKEGLNQKYKYVKVDFTKPVILKNKDQIIIKTVQTYNSDQHTDTGLKTIYAVQTNSGIKILGEDWTPHLPNSTVTVNNQTENKVEKNIAADTKAENNIAVDTKVDANVSINSNNKPTEPVTNN